MKNAKWNSIDEFDDISTKDQYQIAREAGLSDREAMEACNRMSRDNARTPFQWDDSAYAGECRVYKRNGMVKDKS